MNNNLLLIAQVGFAALTVIYFALFVKMLFQGIDTATWSTDRKTKYRRGIVIVLMGWLAFTSFWSLSGIMSDFSLFPFNFMPVLAVPLIIVTWATFSPGFTEILQRVPHARVVRLQSFRFFVEILLWTLFVANIIPVQMSFEGRNFDILAGITAPFIAWMIAQGKLSKGALIFWNIACLALLINIVSIAILSTPTPIRIFMNEPANTIVATFPIVLLPAFLVPLAYTLHLFSLRQLTAGQRAMAQ